MPKFTTIATTLEADRIAEVGDVIHNINSSTGSGDLTTDGKAHETHDCQPISFAYEKVKPRGDSEAAVKEADAATIARRDAAKRLLPPGVRANVGDYYCEFQRSVLVIPGAVFEALTSK